MRFIWIFIVVLAVYWCKERSTPLQIADGQLSIDFGQQPGCLNSQLGKKDTQNSDCFNYNFDQNLQLEFCVTANCCPDSDRFDYTHEIINNTIYLTVLDTAQNLCNCICNYKIQAEMIGLLRDAYVFKCLYKGSIIYDMLVYRQQDIFFNKE